MPELQSLKRYLRPAEAAAYTGVAASTLAKRRLRGDPPTYLKIATNTVVYAIEDLDAWLQSCRRSSTSDGGY